MPRKARYPLVQTERLGEFGVAALNPARIAIRLRRAWARLSSAPVYAARPRLPMSANAARIHDFTRRRILARRRGADRLGLWLEWVLWYACVPARVAVNTGWHGPAIRRRTGKGLTRQVAEQLLLAHRGSIPPKSYYQLRLYEPHRRSRAGDYLLRSETKNSLYRFLRPEPAAGRGLLSDKLVFERVCRSARLRTVPVLLEAREGALHPMSARALPACDLIVKPRRGRGGRKVAGWYYGEEGRYRSSEGASLDGEGLARHLREQSRRHSYLVQPCLVNHPELADLTTGVLMTVRMLTCTNEAGRGEVTNASFRLGGDHPVVDNMHRGGLAAAVDLRTGRLGPAIGLEPTADWQWKNPRTGAPIAGRELPGWQDAVDLACRAHDVFSEFVVIGWDVALLEDGPCLIEGNSSPCVNLIQRPLGAPLGAGRFGELVAHRIALLEGETGRRP